MLTNTNNGRLGINISELWQTENKFTLRFRDISEEQKTKLSTRIKLTAPYYTIRKERGPTIEDIKNTLTEFNPIIFAEGQAYGNDRQSYKNFGVYVIRSMSGYYFKEICRSIYCLKCLKRKLKRREYSGILRTTTSSWTAIDVILDRNRIENIGPNNPISSAPQNIEIGMTDLENIRRNIENQGYTNVPRGMYQREETIEERAHSVRIMRPICEGQILDTTIRARSEIGREDLESLARQNTISNNRRIAINEDWMTNPNRDLNTTVNISEQEECEVLTRNALDSIIDNLVNEELETNSN